MLKLIFSGLWLYRCRRCVSIHPMLKLILQFPRFHLLYCSFNTSHVKVNLAEQIASESNLKRFNTSHVKVNRIFVRSREQKRCVSIHPMLKLIQRISSIPYNTLYQIPQYLSTFLKFLPAVAPFAKKIHKITAIPLFLRIHAILH